MSECPECGADVPSGGKFCPECGVRLEAGGGRASGTHQSSTSHDRQAHESDENWDYPVDPAAESRPEDHKLMLGGVAVFSLIGLVEGIAQVVYADAIVEIAESEFGFGGEFAADQLVMAGIFGAVISLAVIGATAYFYREGYFRKAYFWGLVGGGIAGFLLAQSLFLTVLLAFGIYGLVSISD